jgi:hypothetical protein
MVWAIDEQTFHPMLLLFVIQSWSECSVTFWNVIKKQSRSRRTYLGEGIGEHILSGEAQT